MSDPAEVLKSLGAATSAGDQLEVLQRAWGSAGLVELSLGEAQVILDQLAKATSMDQQLKVLSKSRDERQTACAFDVALAPIIMSRQQVRHIESLLRKCISKGDGASIARLLDSFEESCFLSAAQAAQLLSCTDHCTPNLKREICHVVCSRVLDRYNLTEEQHTEAACYYGWDMAYLAQLLRQAVAELAAGEVQALVLAEQSSAGQASPPTTSRLLQNRVLAHMGKGGHERFARCYKVPMFASRIIARNLSAGSSDCCAICLEETHNGTQLWTCATCGKQLHHSCHRSWVATWERRQRAEEDDEDDEGMGGQRTPPCPYCRSVAEA